MSYKDAVASGASDALPWRFRQAFRFAVEWFPLVIVAGLWELISGTAVPRAILPAPSAVLSITVKMLASGAILPHLGISLYRIGIGIGLSIVFGVSLGVGMARIHPIEDFFDVFLALLYPIPKAALVPLAILWLDTDTQISVLIVFLACLLPIVLNSYHAAETVDQNLVRSAEMMGTDDWRLLWKVIIPDTIPEILTGIRQAIPFAFIALVSAEFIAADTGVGYEILRYGQVGNYPQMFAVIILISATAYVAVRIFEILKERTVTWA